MQGKFTRVIPMMSHKDAGKSLIEFTDDVGIPERLITDGAMEFTGRHRICKRSMPYAHPITYNGTRPKEPKPCSGAQEQLPSQKMETAHGQEESPEEALGFWTGLRK